MKIDPWCLTCTVRLVGKGSKRNWLVSLRKKKKILFPPTLEMIPLTLKLMQ